MNLIIYHDNCVDGFTAAWVAHRALSRNSVTEVRLHPASYGQDPPYRLVELAEQVFILDFSYPRAEMEQLISSNKRLVCLDHHRTAEATLVGLPGCEFSQHESGAMMAWRFFRPSDVVPRLIARVSDNDTGQRRLEFADEFNALIGSYPFDLDAYDDMHYELENEPFHRLVKTGAAIRREQQKRVDLTVESAIPVMLGGLEALVVNCADRSQFSSVGVRLAKKAPGGVGGCWYLRQDGVVEWSLRSLRPEQVAEDGRESVDVSILAKRLGGGGHTHAAGFTQTLIQLTDTLSRRMP